MKTIRDNIVVQRAFSSTPPFWRKVRNVCGIIGMLSLVASKLPVIPDEWRTVLNELGTHTLTISGMSQLTTSNRSLSEK